MIIFLRQSNKIMIKRNFFLIILLLGISYIIYIVSGCHYYEWKIYKEIKYIFFWSNIILISFITMNLFGLIFCVKKIKKIWILIILYSLFICNFLLCKFLLRDMLFIFAGPLIIMGIILFSNILSFFLVSSLSFIENRI